MRRWLFGCLVLWLLQSCDETKGDMEARAEHGFETDADAGSEADALAEEDPEPAAGAVDTVRPEPRGSCDQSPPPTDGCLEGTGAPSAGRGCDGPDDCSEEELPACDPVSGTCVECVVDEDCTSTAEPYCDPERSQCAHCVPSRCEGICEIGLGCVECATDGDCAVGAVCDFANHCRATCEDDNGCPDAYCAIDGMCAPPVGMACSSPDDCYPEACTDIDTGRNPVQPYCSRTCLRAEDCPAGFACQELACRKLAE